MIMPHQLKRESFRFVKIKKRSKKPFEQDWQISNNYSYSEIRFWVENKENYGVVCGYGNLAVIDIDRMLSILSKNKPLHDALLSE